MTSLTTTALGIPTSYSKATKTYLNDCFLVVLLACDFCFLENCGHHFTGLTGLMGNLVLPSVVRIAFLLLPLVILETLVTLNPTYAEGLS